MAQFAQARSIWVLPRLERCYLRHENGLTLVRQFFQRLLSGQLGYGVFGCNSWAWSFFRHALELWVPSARVAQAFDADSLARWFSRLAEEQLKGPVVFRQSDNGRTVLKTGSADPGAAGESGSNEASTFLKDLAVFGRGIPGVALAYWRVSLRGEPDTREVEQKQAEKPSAERVVWVQPFSKMDIPKLPANNGRDHAFVLHSLMMHSGLPENLTGLLLPMPAGQLSRILMELKDAGILEAVEDIWRISPMGYPVARQFLAGEGYLMDEF